MNLSEFSIKRSVTISMMFLGIILVSLVSLTFLKTELFPKLEIPVLSVVTTESNVAPEEIEKNITETVEGAVSSIGNIDRIKSVSSRGSSNVILFFDYGTDTDEKANEVRDKIETIKGALPNEAKTPIVWKFDINDQPVIDLAIYGDYDLYKLKQIADDYVKEEISKVSGVGQVEIVGGLDREIKIIIDRKTLEEYGISFNDIRNSIAASNSSYSLGDIQDSDRKIIVRAETQYDSIEDIRNTKINLPSGGEVALSDISEVVDTYKEMESYSSLEDNPAVLLSISKQSDANIIDISDEVLKKLDEIEQKLPSGVEVKVLSDNAQYIRDSINSVVKNALTGGLFALIVLYVFLRNIRATLIVGTAIPISIISTFMLMYFGNLTINIITLGGLTLGIGMMVDGAIVILENIYRYRSMGYNAFEAASKGAREVYMPLIASTLTTVVVFLPMLFVEGLAGQIFKPMALTVVFALSASLLVAVTLVPMLSAKHLNLEKKTNIKPLKYMLVQFNIMLRKIEKYYMGVIRAALRNKKKTIAVVLALFIASLCMLPFLGYNFMPETDEGEFTIELEFPDNSLLEDNIETTQIAYHRVQDHEANKLSYYSVDRKTGSISVVLKKDIDKTTKEVSEEMRANLAGIPGAKIKITESQQGHGSSGVEIKIAGEDQEELERISDQYLSIISEIEGVRDAETDLKSGGNQVIVEVDENKAAYYGVSLSYVYGEVGNYLSGTKAGVFRESGEELDIKIELPEDERKVINDLKRIQIKAPAGNLVPLEEVAQLRYEASPTSLIREDKKKTITIKASLVNRDLNSAMKEINEKTKSIKLPSGYEKLDGGSFADMSESFQSLGLALLLAILLVYMVLAAQFESLIYPFLIMFSLPPVLIGVIFGTLVLGTAITVNSLIGLIMLAGIVVNNAIVLIDFIMQKRDEGMEKYEAIVLSGKTRLRPILMTSLTTILALVPQALGIGTGSESMAPMAQTVVFGLSFSTIITLVLIPVLYASYEDHRDKKALRTAEK